MRQIMIAIASAVVLTAFVGATSASAAQGDAYKVKKAECKKKADGMKFGVHLIKRNRWVKDCIAGKQPV
jgi:hypothetical protein